MECRASLYLLLLLLLLLLLFFLLAPAAPTAIHLLPRCYTCVMVNVCECPCRVVGSYFLLVA
ncbi:hypothetical protein E2C01_097278 [Portunus trituberculatus]|uniref:Uncharacterized protein n=1 Tax=Portunus trituberculatus TaxID=210409 RepID=A0A5B7K950_PORTR|nr:hypothetical protein [Portunus trituberculatus]